MNLKVNVSTRTLQHGMNLDTATPEGNKKYIFDSKIFKNAKKKIFS
jgi:hypothetical protein